jgi:hypothetical protein
MGTVALRVVGHARPLVQGQDPLFVPALTAVDAGGRATGEADSAPDAASFPR